MNRAFNKLFLPSVHVSKLNIFSPIYIPALPKNRIIGIIRIHEDCGLREGGIYLSSLRDTWDDEEKPTMYMLYVDPCHSFA